jgi:DNA-binding NtrC family response regulator
MTGDGSDPGDFLGQVAQRVRSLSVGEWGEDRAVEIVGRSPGFLQVLDKLVKVARYTEPVLITGESGVGKEQLAQAIYLLSERLGHPYVSVNCPQYQDGNLTVSELFGHRKGSFTGAIDHHRGAFEAANGGVIFLDEIADLHLTAQAMLLRALAAGEFKPLGADQSRSADVRVVAATNRALNDLVVAQEFRNDLFFRLHYFLLRLPPLRERGDDWRLILDHLLLRLRCKYGVAKRFSSPSLKILESYGWPGNVRQLVSVATTGYALADGDSIEPDDFASQLEVANGGAKPHERLYRRVTAEGESFWEAVYRPFLNRDLNRAQVVSIIRQGLVAAEGSYRRLVEILRLPASDYQKFMDFLRHHRLKP